VPIILTAIVVLALVALFAVPALAARPGVAGVAQPTIVAAVGDKTGVQLKLDSAINGEIKLDLSSSKLADKWRVTSLKCDDVTVVATGSQGVVGTTKAAPAPGDPTSCVYSLKVPSGTYGIVMDVKVSSKKDGERTTKSASSEEKRQAKQIQEEYQKKKEELNV